MYFVYKYLGWVNIGLLVLILAHFVLRRINRIGFSNKNKFLKKAAAFMSKIHTYLTIVLTATAFFHGFNLAGGIRFHSGYIAFIAILLQATAGALVKARKKKPFLAVHRLTGLLLAATVIIHVIIMKT
ncbi:MAG: hypothetical protein JXB33_10065 [Clostridia bacterium]|nr:hypothetical protein [Clostridia bacterium]